MKRLFLLVLSVMISLCALAQSGVISGKVTEVGGEPVAGAVIYYDGTSVSTITNANGEYSIKSMSGKDLVFTCFGLQSERVHVTIQEKINVRMKSEAQQLDDAVVIGYGTQTRADLTGSVASVKAYELRKAGQDDVLGSLQGKVAGLNITNQSGEPGSGYNIKIRGNNSINASSSPLIVIDGMQMDVDDDNASFSMSTSSSDPLAFLNPVDIQSIEVLKDASSTAIYGARGANGVILITTKSGAENAGKTTVTFDAKVGLTTRMNDIEMLDGQEWINYRFERGDYHYDYFGKDTDGDGIVDAPKTLADYGRTAVDWRNEMLRKAISQNYNVSVRGVLGKNTSILTSLGYLNQQGLIKNNGYKKYTAKVKLDHKASDKVSIGSNIQYMRTVSSGAASSTGGSFSNNGMTQLIYLRQPVQHFVDPADPESELTNETSLLDLINRETYRQGIANRTIGSANLTWKILPSLQFKAYASANINNSSNDEYYSSVTYWGRSKNGVCTYSTTNAVGYTANATLTWKPSLKKGHYMDAMLGVEMNDYQFDSYRQQGTGFEEESLQTMGLGMAQQIDAPTRDRYSNGRMSAFGRVNYNYKWRYYLTFNMRADGSSRFSPESRVGYFPSVSAAWRIVNEPWMKAAKSSWLENLKLRASVGVSGNDRIANYANLSSINKLYYAKDGSQILGMAEYDSGNNKLKWESTTQYDAGFDFTAFKGRVDLTFDAYYKDTHDMLFKATLPSQTGFTQQWQNIGRVENKGLEFSISTINIKRRDFSWSTNITFDMNRNRILSLGEGVEMMANDISKGLFKEEPTRLLKNQPIGIIWGYEWIGNYQLDDFDIFYAGTQIPVSGEFVTSENYNLFDYVLKDGVPAMAGTKVKPGDRKYADLDGDHQVNGDADKKVIGNCYPAFSYGIGNTFNFRNFSFYVFFDGVQGRDLLNEFKARSTPGEGFQTFMYNITRESYYGAWRPENGSNTYARLRNALNTQQPVSSYYVEDASFLRLKTIALSYSMPTAVCRTIHFSSLKLTLTADNIHFWTKYTGINPDMSTTNSTFPGLDRLLYPTGTTYSLGVIATF